VRPLEDPAPMDLDDQNGDQNLDATQEHEESCPGGFTKEELRRTLQKLECIHSPDNGTDKDKYRDDADEDTESIADLEKPSELRSARTSCRTLATNASFMSMSSNLKKRDKSAKPLFSSWSTLSFGKNIARDGSEGRTSQRKSFMTAGPDRASQLRFSQAGMRSSEMILDEYYASERSEGSERWDFWRSVMCCRIELWLFMEEPFLTFKSSLLSAAMVFVIFASVGHSLYVPPVTWTSRTVFAETDVWKFLDLIFNSIFCLDLAVRFWSFPCRCWFLRSPKNVIDMVSVLPFILNRGIGIYEHVPALSFLRWLNAFEAFLRLLKLSRYFWGWQLLFRSVADSSKALVIPLFFLTMIVFCGACFIFVFESIEAERGGDISIDGLHHAVHFSIICLLSISTGPFYDKQAESAVGQAVACSLMLFGMVFMAMPIAIVGSCFSQTWFDQDRIILLEMVRSRLLAQGFTPADTRDAFDEVDGDGSGEIDMDEFKKMISTFNMPSLSPSKLRRLFHYFDADGDGAISFSDFLAALYPDLPEEEYLEDEEDDMEQEVEEDSTHEHEPMDEKEGDEHLNEKFKPTSGLASAARSRRASNRSSFSYMSRRTSAAAFVPNTDIPAFSRRGSNASAISSLLPRVLKLEGPGTNEHAPDSHGHNSGEGSGEDHTEKAQQPLPSMGHHPPDRGAGFGFGGLLHGPSKRASASSRRPSARGSMKRSSEGFGAVSHQGCGGFGHRRKQGWGGESDVPERARQGSEDLSAEMEDHFDNMDTGPGFRFRNSTASRSSHASARMSEVFCGGSHFREDTLAFAERLDQLEHRLQRQQDRLEHRLEQLMNNMNRAFAGMSYAKPLVPRDHHKDHHKQKHKDHHQDSSGQWLGGAGPKMQRASTLGRLA